MNKEMIICLLVIIFVIVGNIITQKNTSKVVEEINSGLTEVKEQISNQYVNQEKAKLKMNEIEEMWRQEHDKMAFYIEHDELEKVETELTRLKADIETKEYTMGVENLDNCIFMLEHIKDKSALKIVNIF